MDLNLSHYETDAYPSPSFVQHGNRRGAVLHCPMPDCNFYAYNYVSYHSHVENIHLCEHCNAFINKKWMHSCPSPGARLGHVGGGQALDLSDFTEISRSHLGAMAVYRYNEEFNTLEVEEAFGQAEAAVHTLVTDLWNIHGSMILEILLGVLMERTRTDEDGNNYLQQETVYFTSKHELHSTGELELILVSSASEITTKVDTFLDNGSQWYVKKILTLDVKIGEIRLFQNAQPQGWLPMNCNRKGFINLRTKELICFQLSVCVSAFYKREKVKNAARGVTRFTLQKAYTWKKYMNEFDWSDVQPEVDIYYGIPKFEKRNSLCVNVFTHHSNGDDVVLMRRSDAPYEKVVNIFLIVKKRKDKIIQTHFVGITDINTFLGAKWKKKKLWFCQRCFRHFNSERVMQNHFRKCEGPVDFKPKEKMPDADECIKFERPEMTLTYPVVFFIDFECFSVPVRSENKQKGKNTVLEYKYEPASYALCVAVQSAQGFNVQECEYYDGEEPVGHCLERLFELAENYLNVIRQTNNFVQPTAEELKQWEEATECHLCHTPFQDETSYGFGNLPDIDWDDDDDDGYASDKSSTVDDDDGGESMHPSGGQQTQHATKCYHHRHFDGAYQFALCRKCNLKIRYKHEIVVLAHGGSNFDFSLLLNYMRSSVVDFSNIKVLAKSSEKIIEIQMTNGRETLSSLRATYSSDGYKPNVCGNRKVRLRFIDNCNYLGSSLANLSTALSKDGCRYWHMLTQSLPAMLPHISTFDPAQIDLLMEKLPFCYQYLSSPDVLKDGHPLPPREHWDNDLKNEKITDADWEMVHRVCEKLQIADLRTFTRVYTILDTVLLCIINTNFRSICMDLYGLDPLYCPTLSGFSWQAFLYKTGATIGLINDPSILKMVTESIRGGLCFNTRRSAFANHELLPNYDPSKERTFIVYYDINGLYAKALTEEYPIGNYQRESTTTVRNIDWKTYDPKDNNNTGFFLRVRLGYPESLQDITRDLPLAPQKHNVQLQELPQFQQGIYRKLEGRIPKTFVTQQRLLAHCHTREDYVLHHSALKFYIGMGMEVLEYLEAFSFTEAPIFKDYVEFTIEMRRKAKSNAMNSVLKLCCNALYGRSLMSNKERLEIRFAESGPRARHLLSLPRCCGFKILNEKTSMIMLRPSKILLNNPIALGATCLDRSKVIYYDAYYNKLKKIFGDNISMAATDTDSHICVIRDPDGTVLEKHVEHRQDFDFSKLKKDCLIFKKFDFIPDLREMNAGKNGLLKIETITVECAIFLKPKVYILVEGDGRLEKRAKGVPGNVMKDVLFETYERVHMNDDVVYVKSNLIRSFNHNLFNIYVKKLGFHSLSVSRAFVSANESLPFGHYRLTRIA